MLQSNGLIYVRLPANLFRISPPSEGKVILMEVDQEGACGSGRTTRKQCQFAATVDEFCSFADLSIVDRLKKLRAHTSEPPSLAALELVSKEFATAVWYNILTRTSTSRTNRSCASGSSAPSRTKPTSSSSAAKGAS